MNVLEGGFPVGAGLVVLLGLLLVEELPFVLSHKSNQSINRSWPNLNGITGLTWNLKWIPFIIICASRQQSGFQTITERRTLIYRPGFSLRIKYTQGMNRHVGNSTYIEIYLDLRLECMTISFEGSFTVAFRHALMLKEVGIMAEFSLERVLVEGCEVLVISKIIK
jgi:hypothetical protein